MERQHDRVRLHPDSLRPRGHATAPTSSGAHLTDAHADREGDVGYTIRLKVVARNSSGRRHRLLSSDAGHPEGRTAIAGNRCPPGDRESRAGYGHHRAGAAAGRHLQGDPPVVTRGTSTLVVRFHVTSTCVGALQGALAHATATPYNQFSIPAEAATGADGWATLVFQRLSGFPVSRHQQLIAMFVRARKPGENLLAGISTRRLVSIRVTRPA